MPARCWQLCLLLGCCTAAQALQVDREVEHSLGSKGYSPAGKLMGEFKTASRYSTQQQVLEFERSSLPQGGRSELADLVKDDRMYKLQLKPQQGSNVSILTSIPARCLASTSCTEQLEVHLTDSGGILAMNYDFAACPCSPEQRVSDTVPSSWSFKEVVPALVRRSRKIAPLTLLPRTEGVDGKSNRPGVQQAQPVVDPATGEVKEPPKDERSFLQKNWMLILPAAFLLVQLMGGMAGSGDAGAGAQRGPRRAAAS